MSRRLLIALMFFACLPRFAMAVELGFSGMAQVDDNSFLVVMDKKHDDKGDRVGILNLNKDGTQDFQPITISDWRDHNGRSNDLESVCRLPGDNNEFLLVESSYRKGKFGRIFHIQLSQNTATVKHVFHLPKLIEHSKKVDGDNFEGTICLPHEQSVLVVLGERGGSNSYQKGYLRLGVLDTGKSQLSWQKHAAHPIAISAPGTWDDVQQKRSISELYVDQQGVIWASATEDHGDQGPFRSVIYRAASVITTGNSLSIKPIPHPSAQWIIDGFKVEAMAGPAAIIPNSYMSIGTEDESYGGIWRPLFKPAQ